MKRMICALAGLVLTGVFGQASVIYTFDGTGTGVPGLDPEPVAFTLTVPTFINPSPGGFVSFTCAQLDSNTNCQSDASFPQIVFIPGLPAAADPAIVSFYATNNAGYFFRFYFGAFTTPGTYTSVTGGANPGTLTVAFAPESVPEPQTLSMVAMGLLGGLIGWGRRRRRKT